MSKDITHDIIKELLRREIPLKNIVDDIVASINSSIITDITKNYEIFQCVKKHMKSGEYWYIARSMVLILIPDKHIVESILYDCISHEKLSDIRDINNMLINKLPPGIISQLDKKLMTDFKSLLSGKVAKDTYNVESVRDFGESFVEMDTIASPDSKQMESPESFNNAVINSSQTNNIKKCDQEVNVINKRPYILHPIGNYIYSISYCILIVILFLIIF